MISKMKENQGGGTPEIRHTILPLVDSLVRKVDQAKSQFEMYFNDSAMIRLASDLEAGEKSGKTQREVLGEYAENIFQDILPFLQGGKNVVINMGAANTVDEFKDQIKPFIEAIETVKTRAEKTLTEAGKDYEKYQIAQEEVKDEAREKGLDYQTFLVYRALCRRLRKDILQILERKMEEQEVSGHLGMRGEIYGRGGMGEVYAFHMGGRNIVAKIHLTPVNRMGELRYMSQDFVRATLKGGADSPLEYYGTAEIKLQRQNEPSPEIYYIDFYEEINPKNQIYDVRNTKPFHRKMQFVQFTEKRFLPFLRQLKQIHDSGYVHRDVKPENVLLAESVNILSGKAELKARLIDYELAAPAGDKQPYGPIGTDWYASPEQQNEEEVTIDPSADIFSVGMMLYDLLTEEWHPDAQTDVKKARKETILNFNTYFKNALQGVDENIKKELNSLIKRCLDIDPKKRPTTEELIGSLEEIINKIRFKDNFSITQQAA